MWRHLLQFFVTITNVIILLRGQVEERTTSTKQSYFIPLLPSLSKPLCFFQVAYNWQYVIFWTLFISLSLTSKLTFHNSDGMGKQMFGSFPIKVCCLYLSRCFGKFELLDTVIKYNQPNSWQRQEFYNLKTSLTF